jgi:hypothetical protein
VRQTLCGGTPSPISQPFWIADAIAASAVSLLTLCFPGVEGRPVREFDEGEEYQQHYQGTYRGFEHYRPLFCMDYRLVEGGRMATILISERKVGSSLTACGL